MKYLSLLLPALCLMLCSCNNNDETALEIALPISETYVPVTVGFNKNDLDDAGKQSLIHLVNNEHVINDESELPDDPIGFSEAYHTINFKESTLLIKYVLHNYMIETYSTRYYRNTQENSYNWSVNIGTASDTGIDTDDIRFTRFAILVRKLPADAQVRSWLWIKSTGWYPAELTALAYRF